jgi:hypothetical protein
VQQFISDRETLLKPTDAKPATPAASPDKK